MKFSIDSKKVVLVSVFLVFLLLVGGVFAQRGDEETSGQKPGLAGRFLDSFVCIFTQCGWPAIVIFILPPIAIYIWKKVFSWG